MTQVKICGIKSLNEAVTAIQSGAWAVGEVFAASPRQLEVDRAAAINRELKAGIVKIGVFVNREIESLKEIVRLCGLDMVQLHGDEPPEYLEELPVPAIKSFRVDGPVSLRDIRRWRPWAYLFDSYSRAARGGTGSGFNWEWLAEIKGRERIILAGGLNEKNVGRAIQKVRPAVVDVSSAVEFPGGGKDPARIKAFITKVKETDAEIFDL